MCLSCICCCCEILLRSSCCILHARISWQCIVIVSRAWVSWQCYTEETSQEMIRLRGVAWDDSPAGCRIRNCIQSSLDTSLVNIRLLGLYWDAPVLLSSVASNVSITGLRLRGDLAMLLEARRFLSCFSWVSRLRGEASAESSLKIIFFFLTYNQFCDILVILKRIGRTSWLAERLYCPRMKLNVHVGASFVIARRGQGFKDAV